MVFYVESINLKLHAYVCVYEENIHSAADAATDQAQCKKMDMQAF